MAVMTFEQAEASLATAGIRAQLANVSEMRALADSALADVLSDWPSATGESAAGFSMVATFSGAEISNDVDYAFFVGQGLAHDTLSASINGNESETIGRIESAVSFILEEG